MLYDTEDARSLGGGLAAYAGVCLKRGILSLA